MAPREAETARIATPAQLTPCPDALTLPFIIGGPPRRGERVTIRRGEDSVVVVDSSVVLWPGDAATVSEDATPDAELVKLHFTTSDKHIHWLQVRQAVLARWLGPPLPLHTAIVTEDNPVVARALLAASPRSAGLAVDGRLPLHLAPSCGRSARRRPRHLRAPRARRSRSPRDVHRLHAAIRLRHPLRVAARAAARGPARRARPTRPASCRSTPRCGATRPTRSSSRCCARTPPRPRRRALPAQRARSVGVCAAASATTSTCRPSRTRCCASAPTTSGNIARARQIHDARARARARSE